MKPKAEKLKRHEHELPIKTDRDSAYYWTERYSAVEIPHPRPLSPSGLSNRAVKEKFRSLAKRIALEHSEISTNPNVLSGTPHIQNTRLSVAVILGKLYLYGSILEVVENYKPHLSEEQVKAALAYAQDFLEIALDPTES